MPAAPTIFLIDDDPIQLKIAVKMLERAIPRGGVTTFSDGGSALEFLETHRQQAELLPDLIFLDLNMPELSGWDFLEIFEGIKQTLAKHIGIYILSSSEDEQDLERSKGHLSVLDYIVKPITDDRIRLLLE
jgi:CheY-like chemotaxis protein